jgi:hypothetical protein
MMRVFLPLVILSRTIGMTKPPKLEPPPDAGPAPAPGRGGGPGKGGASRDDAAWNLDPSPSFKGFTDYDGWTDCASRLTDSDGNQFSVSYDNITRTFKYYPELKFSAGVTTNVVNIAGDLDIFYQYKFFLDSGTTTYAWWQDWENIANRIL